MMLANSRKRRPKNSKRKDRTQKGEKVKIKNPTKNDKGKKTERRKEEDFEKRTQQLE